MLSRVDRLDAPTLARASSLLRARSLVVVICATASCGRGAGQTPGGGPEEEHPDGAAPDNTDAGVDFDAVARTREDASVSESGDDTDDQGYDDPDANFDVPDEVSPAGCAGTSCSCFAEVAASAWAQRDEVLVRRADGTVWWYDDAGGVRFNQVMKPDASPLIASSVAVAESSRIGTPHQIGCAVSEGAVWCFPGGTLTDSTFLGAGLGTGIKTSGPVAVATAVGGAALSGAVQIAGGSTDAPPTFCAVTDAGAIWCWGNGYFGQLGRGDTADSSYARPVLADATTTFTGAVEVRLGYDSACARKGDGTVWCWGQNYYAQLGVDHVAVVNSYYPVQVPFRGTASHKASRHLLSGADLTWCSIMHDLTVVCWGRNDQGLAGAAITAGPPPRWAGLTVVAQAAGGPPLTGVLDLAVDQTGTPGERTCARTMGLDIVCWGAGSPTPTPYLDGAMTPVGGVRVALASSSSGLVYVDARDVVRLGGAVLTAQPPCAK
jgi:hypothetical protein